MFNPKKVWEGDFFVKALCPDLAVAKANSGWAEKLPKCPKQYLKSMGNQNKNWDIKSSKPKQNRIQFRFGCSFFSPTYPNTSWLRKCFGLYFGGPNTFSAGVWMSRVIYDECFSLAIFSHRSFWTSSNRRRGSPNILPWWTAAGPAMRWAWSVSCACHWIQMWGMMGGSDETNWLGNKLPEPLRNKGLKEALIEGN